MTETYTKTYQRFTPEMVRAIVTKYQYLNVHLPVGSQVPKVVSHTDNSITFVDIPLVTMQSVRTIMAQESRATVAKRFHLIGAEIARLHQALQPAGYVHGDLWPGNIYFTGDTVVVIDFEPTNANEWEHSIYNRVEFDLAKFIVVAESLQPKSPWWRYPLCRRRWYEAFLSGYTEAGGCYEADYLYPEVRRWFLQRITSVWQNKNRSVANKLGAMLFRCITWMMNPMLRGKPAVTKMRKLS